MALIVNADDFGASESVNAAICEAFEKGLAGRTTLMTNMPFAKEAMDLARERGFIDKVGLHINLTSGVALTEEMRHDPVMCDASGKFTADFARNLKTRFFLPAATRKSVEAEIRAQLDRYKELGGTLWHIDSHHHVHTDPSIWSVIKKVIRDYPINSVRLSRNMYRGGNPLMHIFKTILNTSIRKRCCVRPDLFGSAADYEVFFAPTQSPGERYNIEIMVHPVYDSDGKLCDKSMDKFRVLRSYC